MTDDESPGIQLVTHQKGFCLVLFITVLILLIINQASVVQFGTILETGPLPSNATNSTSKPPETNSTTQPSNTTTQPPTTTTIPPKKDQLAFITSSYFYPESESLGPNSLVLVFTMNQLRTLNGSKPLAFNDRFETDEIVIIAENATNELTFTTKLQQVSNYLGCQWVVSSAITQITPNVQRIMLASGNDTTVIPFSTPKPKPRDVVFCISPIFMNDNWQNFLFAVHIYKHFGAHTHLYLSSAVTSFYLLMREYEKKDYITLQAWNAMNFPGVSREYQWVEQVEFRNQAAAQTDCLLQYKEAADFVGFLDFDDILVPKIEPTYIQELQDLMGLNETHYFVMYTKENYNISTTEDASTFSFIEMLKSLDFQARNETGKIVVPPENLNGTWIHGPVKIPPGKIGYHTTLNSITHLKNIRFGSKLLKKTKTDKSRYSNSKETIMSEYDSLMIERDMKKTFAQKPIKEILRNLPKEQFYGNSVRKCYYDVFYKGGIACSGPGLCKFKQHPKITCVHVNATYTPMPRLYPITFYYSTDTYFTQKIGCYP